MDELCCLRLIVLVAIANSGLRKAVACPLSLLAVTPPRGVIRVYGCVSILTSLVSRRVNRVNRSWGLLREDHRVFPIKNPWLSRLVVAIKHC